MAVGLPFTGHLSSAALGRYNSLMCGRFTLRTPTHLLVKHFGMDAAVSLGDPHEVGAHEKYEIWLKSSIS